jgi:hypothetical protein
MFALWRAAVSSRVLALGVRPISEMEWPYQRPQNVAPWIGPPAVTREAEDLGDLRLSRLKAGVGGEYQPPTGRG